MTLKTLFKAAAILGLAGFAFFWVLTVPAKHDTADIQALNGNTEQGAQVFAASGCASCHADKNAKGEDRLILSGGREFATDFGTFYAPNISPDPKQGVGDWTLLEFANAVSFGTSPNGKHYFPAFPYATYQNMELSDIADLYAYLKTLPASAAPSKPHAVPFPFSIRRSLGMWKLLLMPKGFHMDAAGLDPQEMRGRYLVEAMGHCTECHTSRNILGGLQTDKWLAGAPNPDGKGRIPNITPHDKGIKAWSDLDIVTYLNSGFTPEYDSAGGAMAEVIENMSQLPAADHQAIAAYLQKLPALPTP